MCVLHIDFETDNLDLILSSTNIPVYQVYKKGDNYKHRKDKTYDRNLISCVVSDKEWDDVEGQTDDIIIFIEKHQNDLEFIKENVDNVDWKFDLPYHCRLSDTLFNQNNFLSPQVLLLCGKLGIGLNLSLYHPPCDEQENENIKTE